MTGRLRVCLLLIVLNASTAAVRCETPEQRGYRLLTEKAYLPHDFDQSTFDEVWRVWPDRLREKAAELSPEQRREMAFARYGLSTRPDDASWKPLQYVVDDQGRWTMNCFSCHGGQVDGLTFPGAPNSLFALETLTAEIRATKLRLGKPLTRMDIGSVFMPLGRNNGTTNAVMFGVALMAYRKADLTLVPRRLPPPMMHHDMDAPPWWHFHRKQNLYIDGFAPKGPRPLMQFMLVEENGPERFRGWEQDFHDVYAYLQSLRPPRFTGPINQQLAAQGQAAYRRICAACHGTYGPQRDYPERVVPIEVVGTDDVRHRALTSANRDAYGKSWFGHFGRKQIVSDPVGYVAPPLDGVWASAPYFHNGSVPTLWHVLHPDQRPVVWKRAESQPDLQRVGLQVETFDTLPESVKSLADRRAYFNTAGFGKSSSGHDFPDALSPEEKVAVLEYLKTL